MSIPRIPVSTVWRDIFALAMVVLSAYLASEYTLRGQRTLEGEHAAALQKVVRFEAAQNLRTLERSTVSLKGIASNLEAFIKGEAPAPTVGPGYLGLATVGLRMHLEGRSAYYIPPGLLVVYAFIHERLARHAEVQRALDTAATRYASAMTPQEKHNAAVNLLITIRHQLAVSVPLISQEGGLPVFLKCLDQFSAGEEVCEFSVGDSPEADGQIQPPR